MSDNVESSTYFYMRMHAFISFTIKKNASRPRMAPCGIAPFKQRVEDTISRVLTCCLWRRNFASRFMRYGLICSFSYLSRLKLWSGFSKALVKSIKIVLTVVWPSIASDKLWTRSTSMWIIQSCFLFPNFLSQSFGLEALQFFCEQEGRAKYICRIFSRSILGDFSFGRGHMFAVLLQWRGHIYLWLNC